jgi:signal peptidase I
MEANNLQWFLLMWAGAWVGVRLGLHRLFQAAGKDSWKAWVPVYSWYVWIQIVGRPWWYLIGMLIPCVNILFSFNLSLDLLRSFGKNSFKDQFLGIVFSFAYFPIWAWRDEKLTYRGPAGDKQWRKDHVPVNGGSREWADALLFAAYVAGGMRALFFDLYQIPTPSMESNLKVGDYLVVSRVKIGMRIPFTPVALPVYSAKELFGIPAYVSSIQLPYMRLPGWYTVKNNDVMVFNWPGDDDRYPIDRKDNYVKRCVGIPGDTVQMIEGQIYINHKKLPVVGMQQKRYLVMMSEPITQEFLLKYDLGDFLPARRAMDLLKAQPNLIPYNISTYPANASRLQADPAVKVVMEDIKDDGQREPIFPDTLATQFLKHRWDVNNWGPVYLPKRGQTITLTAENWDVLKLAINKYEGNNIVVQQRGQNADGSPKVAFVTNGGSGEEVESYTFEMGYYWMIGDNRYNSLDSRFWGYVPEDHMLGKPLFTFFGLKKVIGIDELGLPLIQNNEWMYESKGIRWNKIFRAID